VLAAGLIVVGTGVWNGYRAISRNFEKQLKQAEMSETERTWTVRAGVVGHLARMIAYFVVGWFLVRAALEFDPQKPVGLDQSLHALAAASYGPFLLFAVGVGLIAFGLYQVMLARYREVLDS
jgi:sulfite exporter TauE/SafE